MFYILLQCCLAENATLSGRSLQNSSANYGQGLNIIILAGRSISDSLSIIWQHGKLSCGHSGRIRVKLLSALASGVKSF
jgi:hypothetical protein